ncbi:LysR family transcriptional regulator [Aliiruegeria lutimaris]|uniref:DNA-binding transcriptional regulator, LysR family n=1 Tax=Aliiruegeria lutimaris TaxID=571298 RepID=A0A1G8WD88_9RHOB|nr:LysR family transcriptional regulator [Aliiruegeria lutimaris]SDJ75550.1 DNA-binding transcriptional regulator, LysR family [Aliiruegeria lutimaris]
MDLALLEDFLELARELNFSRAAGNRNMTQPAFSRRIKNLETAFQTPLIHRTTRQVTLTPAGKAFQPRAEAIVRMLSDARLEALEAAGLAQRNLNLAATHALSYTFVPRWLMQVGTPAEIGALNMVSDTYRQCLRLMQNGGASFFICHKGLAGNQELPGKQFLCHPIASDCLAPLCAPDAEGLPLWELGSESRDVPFIAYAGASGLHAILEAHWAENARPGIKPTMNSVLASTNLEMAKEGQGVAYLPLSLARSDIEHGSLTRAGGEEFDVPVQVVIYRPHSRMSPHCEAFWKKVVGRADG